MAPVCCMLVFRPERCSKETGDGVEEGSCVGKTEIKEVVLRSEEGGVCK